MPSTVPLTRRQREILDFFRAYCARTAMSPTLEEIASHFGVNKVTIFGHVAELERKGVLRRAARGISRGLQLVGDPADSESARQREIGPCLPIIGTIAAGSPLEAIEDAEQLDLGELVPRGSEVFALRVKGDSMIEDSIREGDIVLVERRSTARNGQTVVAVLPEGDATLKRYYLEKDGRVRLQPANAALQPIHVPSVEIRGVVVGVVRTY